jgi:rhodanese-related sulfurtransferase
MQLQTPKSSFNRSLTEIKKSPKLCDQSFCPSNNGESFSIDISLLPQKKYQDSIRRIDAENLTRIMDGMYSEIIDEFIIIDTRFNYEFNGGHIKGAININDKDALNSYFFSNNTDNAMKKRVLVFHCEFSLLRGPKMASHLRSQDRILNGLNYPKLFYPEIYVLDGGYKEFHNKFKNYCNGDYVEMKNTAFKSDLKIEKTKKKSLCKKPSKNDNLMTHLKATKSFNGRTLLFPKDINNNSPGKAMDADIKNNSLFFKEAVKSWSHRFS